MRGKHETVKVITSVEWGQTERERESGREKQILGHRVKGKKKIWRELENESTAMNNSTRRRNGQVRRGGMDKERAVEEE